MSYEKIFYEFEILTEFKREKIYFNVPFFTPTYSKVSLYFLSNTQYKSIYLNNIRVFMNTDFYFDYSTSSNCYLSYYIPSLYCLKAKKGYVTYKG